MLRQGRGIAIASFLSLWSGALFAAEPQVQFSKDSAVVWSMEQTLTGTFNGADSIGSLYQNGRAIPLRIRAGRFQAQVKLSNGENHFLACIRRICSERLTLTLGYKIRPQIRIQATAEGTRLRLKARALENPGRSPLYYSWDSDQQNPSSLAWTRLGNDEITVDFNQQARAGEYYFNVSAAESKSRILVNWTGTNLRPMTPLKGRASWIDRAIIYGLAPAFISDQTGRKFRDIQSRLGEIQELGVNTLWLQPIYETHRGWQAYDVTDYFKIWRDLGTAEDLKSLINSAHARGMKVIFDFVANHTSISHGYALDYIQKGNRSHYQSFYQRLRDQAPYSEHYHEKRVGQGQFIYYFWEDLVNLNFDNPEVRRYLTEAAKYWVENFDIDGYRFDASWAPSARRPDFFISLREELKSLKPEILFLAEDKASYPEALRGRGIPAATEVFDVAYDWTGSREYVSEWSWQRGTPQETIFNSVSEEERVSELRNSVEAYRPSAQNQAQVLRFIENNDTPRFTSHHSTAQKKMAASLIFTLPGVPLLYYGQEVGTRDGHPTFQSGQPIRSLNRDGLWEHYRWLLSLRNRLPELQQGEHTELTVRPVSRNNLTHKNVYAFKRQLQDRAVIVISNLGSRSTEVTTALDFSRMPSLTDLDTGQSLPRPDVFQVSLGANQTRIFLLTETEEQAAPFVF